VQQPCSDLIHLLHRQLGAGSSWSPELNVALAVAQITHHTTAQNTLLQVPLLLPGAMSCRVAVAAEIFPLPLPRGCPCTHRIRLATDIELPVRHFRVRCRQHRRREEKQSGGAAAPGMQEAHCLYPGVRTGTSKSMFLTTTMGQQSARINH
jgi:hypothetical protein